MNLTLSIGKFSESLRCKHADQYSILKQLIIVLFRLESTKEFLWHEQETLFALKKEKKRL